MTQEEYFVLSRIDGYTTVREVIAMVGFPPQQTAGILRRLKQLGLLLGEGETPEDVVRRLQAEAQASVQKHRPRRHTRPNTVPDTPSPVGDSDALAILDELSSEEAAAMDEDVELTEDEKVRILAMRRKSQHADYFALLGVERSVDTRTLKRAYFRLCKEFHPDRYYGKNTGAFAAYLAMVFEGVSKAFDILSDGKKRQEYQAELEGGLNHSSQTKVEYAAELFERACTSQVNGDMAAALQFFSAAIRLDEQVRYLSRAARCAVDAGEYQIALDYAGRAADQDQGNASVLRVLATAYEAEGNIAAAESVLLTALELELDNDALVAGLRADLERVRSRIHDHSSGIDS